MGCQNAVNDDNIMYNSHMREECDNYIKRLVEEYRNTHILKQARDLLIGENNIEKRDIKGYHGREILELLQNADDAYQKSIINGCKPNENLEVSISYIDNVLTVVNTGTFFDEDGIKAIVQGNNSSKSGKYIGSKGTGFRSILNWAKSVKIFSGDFNVEFSKSIVIGLTGTPSTNGLMDLWAEYRLLDLGQRLGRYITQYRLRYFQPDKRNGMQIFSYKPLPGAEEQIYKAIGDITISMKSADYLKMPEKVVSTVEVCLSEDERSIYDNLKDEFVLKHKGEEITASNAAVLSGKLIQLANGAVYSDDGKTISVHERKLEALQQLIEEANGKSLLVAYWYKHDRERIIELLKKLEVRFSDLAASQSIADWNKGRLDIGLIHPASSGHGLNLQEGGSTIVWFGLTWSLELYQQTNARLYRQGQKEKTVVIQHIVCKGTIDERIMKALSGKQRIQDELIDAVRAEVTDA